jgi:hypothetical protein
LDDMTKAESTGLEERPLVKRNVADTVPSHLRVTC